jgi:glycosyltransferase involved in cell wall biosynthesis
MKRLLIVTNLFAPALSPRAFRWHAIARHWVGQGHAVEVITAPHGGAPAKEHLDGILVQRVGGRLDRWRSRLAPAGGPAAPGAPARRSSALRHAAKWLHDRTWKQLYWPDYAAPWLGPAMRAARTRLAEAPVDALITVALPFTAHLVGLACRPAVRTWLADSGDPFSLNAASPPNNAALYDARNRRSEAQVLAACDSFTVTTAATRERYLAAFPHARGKVQVIPPLAAPAPVETSASPYFPADGRLRLVYLGNLYRSLREPGPLFELLRGLRQREPDLAQRLELHFFGAAGDFAAELAAMTAEWPGFHAHGPVDRPTVARVLASADGLVNIGNATEDQLPSKLAEYAATGKPILNLASREQDSSAAFLAAYPLARTVVSRDGIFPLAPLADFLRHQAGQRLPLPDIAGFLEPYTVHSVADAYLAALSPRGRSVAA